jgi:hypothetical protein
VSGESKSVRRRNAFVDFLYAFTTQFDNYSVAPPDKSLILIMARLQALLRDTLQRDLPQKDKLQLALQFLRDNPKEKSSTAARLYHIEKEGSVQKAWAREKKRMQASKKRHSGGTNKILRPDQHQAMIQYAVDQATNGGKGATKQMMYNCAMWLRVQKHKTIPSWRWFQLWLKNTPELHTIKTKPIASY